MNNYGYSGSMLLIYANVHYPSTEWSKYSNCTVNSSKYGKIRDTLLSSSSSMLNSLLLSRTDSIIDTHDPMQNPGLIWIFYEPGQTYFTQTKHDQLTRITRLTQPGFNPGIMYLFLCNEFMNSFDLGWDNVTYFFWKSIASYMFINLNNCLRQFLPLI